MYAIAQTVAQKGPGFIGFGRPNPWVELVGHLLWVGFFIGVIALVVLVVMRLAGGSTATAPGSPSAKPDAALTELRLRYARGEVSRDDYLRMAADLGGEVPVPDAEASTS